MKQPAANHADWQQSPLVDRVASHSSLDMSGANPTTSGHTHGHLTATLAAAAVASGHQSVTEGSITNTVKEVGNCIIAFGEARAFEAETQSSAMPGGAHAATSLTISGADLVYEARITETGHTGSVDFQASITEYVAVKFLGVTHNGTANLHALDPAILARVCLEMVDHQMTPSGVLGEIDASAQTFGSDGVAVTSTLELSVEDQFSCIVGLSTVAL
jgi:hypothetical protein